MDHTTKALNGKGKIYKNSLQEREVDGVQKEIVK